MNKKITTTELAEMLSAQGRLSKKAATAFVKEFQSTILEGLEQDKIVKINGIGTIKLIEVAVRKSVDVNTGKSIEIPAHEKVTFSMDANLKDALNGTNVATDSDPLKKMAEQANELKDILAEMGTPVTNEKTTDAPVYTKAEESIPTPVAVEQLEEKEAIKAVPTHNATANNPTTPDDNKKKETGKSKSYVWLVWVTLICVLLMAAGVVYYLFSNEINELITGKKTEQVTIVKPTPRATVEEEEEEKITDATASAATTKEEKSVLATVVTTDGATFAYYARKYYGHPDFWIYIYNANKSTVKNPHVLHVGTTLIIPKMDPTVVDANNPDAIAKAIELAKGL